MRTFQYKNINERSPHVVTETEHKRDAWSDTKTIPIQFCGHTLKHFIVLMNREFTFCWTILDSRFTVCTQIKTFSFARVFVFVGTWHLAVTVIYTVNVEKKKIEMIAEKEKRGFASGVESWKSIVDVFLSFFLSSLKV